MDDLVDCYIDEMFFILFLFFIFEMWFGEIVKINGNIVMKIVFLEILF